MKQHTLFILAMLAILPFVSCNSNNKKSRNQKLTQVEVQSQKQALADSVVVIIDELSSKYIDDTKATNIKFFELTETEKMVKPDYLLDLKAADELVTKSQKINALAIYIYDLYIRALYDMPVNEAKEVIAKLAVEVNHPVDFTKVPDSDRVKACYNACKENGDLVYFWKFQNAMVTEVMYISHQNPELFLSKITEDQWNSFNEACSEYRAAIQMLAEYDEEMAVINDMLTEVDKATSKPDKEEITLEYAKQNFVAHKDTFTAFRNSLIQ